MSSQIKSIDIIVPCFNPEKGWSKYVIENFDKIIKQDPSSTYTLIIVNDASAISIEEEIKYVKDHLDTAFKFISYDVNMGKGFAIREGVKHSQADAVIYTDIDFPYITENLFKTVQILKTGKDVVVGVRSKSYYESVPSRRVLLSKIARFLLKNILKLKVTDTQCGLKGFSKKAKSTFLSTRINRFLFDMEFIYKAGKKKELTIVTNDVTLREGVKFSKMNFRVVLNETLNFITLYFFN